MIKDELAKSSDAETALIKGLSNRISQLEQLAKEHGWNVVVGPPPPPEPPPPPPPSSQEVA